MEILKKLPDELVLKIFSYLPMYEESFAEKFVSKRRWNLEKEVTFDIDNSYASFVAIMSFIYGSLLAKNAQTLESLHLKFSDQKHYSAWLINFIARIAAFRSLKELRIEFFGKTLKLPTSLRTCKCLKTLILHDLTIDMNTWVCLPTLEALHLFSVKFSSKKSLQSLLRICKTLKTLILRELIIDVDTLFLLPSLEVMHLFSVKFLGEESLQSLLSVCPKLEDLVVDQTKVDNMKIFNINVPTLKKLNVDNSNKKPVYVEEIRGFVINAPLLTDLRFKDTVSNFLIFEYMPEVTEANIEVICDQSEKFIGSLTSIEHLSLCSLTSKTPYPRGTFFFYLEHLELCTCSAGWANLLSCMLNDAPRLKSLKLKSMHRACFNDPMNLWTEPTDVPECLSTHLEVLEWRQYEGTEQERKVAGYILANSTCLKMATFSTRCRNKHHRMLKKVKSMFRVSETCQLVFD